MATFRIVGLYLSYMDSNHPGPPTNIKPLNERPKFLTEFPPLGLRFIFHANLAVRNFFFIVLLTWLPCPRKHKVLFYIFYRCCMEEIRQGQNAGHR